MEARKVQVKLFIESPAEVDIDPIVPVFHDWIRQKALDELLIDVTDYAHVHHAPALLLVGHGSDYAIDFTGGRAGLLYSRKREFPNGAEATVKDAFVRALRAAKRLEGETSLPAPIRFRADEILFRVNDRLLGPNTKETIASVLPVVKSVASAIYGGSAFTIEPEGTPRELLTLRIRAPGVSGLDTLLKRVD
jgi:hypothetical protein